MVFSSIIFLLYFLPVFLVIYSFSNKKTRNYIILLASLLFYSWGAPTFIFVLLGFTVIDFYLIKLLNQSAKERERKIYLFLSVGINVSLLFYFKYANFFVANLNEALDNLSLKNLKWKVVALPIGISFYTFQSITYSVDVYKKISTPLKKLSDYILYIFCFPQMIAGPIVRFHTLAYEIAHRVESIDLKLSGFYRFCIGLSKKVLIANTMGKQADFILDGNLNNLQSGEAWLGLTAYTFQIYFDFSGYSDMAIGLGKMIGFHFPENFDSPYTARSITQFWKKWHITLGAFMRDYLYIPLGGNRVSKSRLYFNLIIVFVLSGLWHGASWNFMIWGAYHGLFIILDRLFLEKFLLKAGKFGANIFTFFVVMLGWLIFRIEDLSRFKIYFLELFRFSNFEIPNTFKSFYFILLLAVFFSFIAKFKIGKRLDKFFFEKDEYQIHQHLGLSFIAFILLILSLSSITSSGFNPFIYFRF